MKRTLILLSVLIIGISTYAQQSGQNDLRGNWSLSGAGDGDMSLHFVDKNKVYLKLNNSRIWNGRYQYSIGKQNSDMIIRLYPDDKIIKDSVHIIVTNLTEDSFQIKDIVHFYSDGRPPEGELLENRTYILKKAK